MRKRFALWAAMALAACTASGGALTPEEEKIADAGRVERAIALQAKSVGRSVEPLKGTNADFEEIVAPGIVVATGSGDGHAALASIRKQLEGTAYRAYLNDNAYGTGADKVAVLKADDFAYLAIVRTDGINHDLTHEEVLARYKTWSAQYGLRLVGAGQDWIEAEITAPPADWDAFAKQVHAFCPDVVEQGTGDVAGLAEEMRQTRTLFLWWD